MVVVAPEVGGIVSRLIILSPGAVLVGLNQHRSAVSPLPVLHAEPLSRNDGSISVVDDASTEYPKAAELADAKKVKFGTVVDAKLGIELVPVLWFMAVDELK